MNHSRTALLLLFLALLAGCTEHAPPRGTPEPPIIPAQVITIASQEITETYNTSGTLIADNSVEIASRLMGYIRDLEVREGSTVRKGDLLLTIDPTEIEARLAEARARSAQARARADKAEQDFERFRTLYEKRLIPLSQFQKAEVELEVAREEMRVAQANEKRIGVQLQYAEIRSPVDGVVVKKYKQAGDITTPGAPILSIDNPDNIVLETFIKEDHIKEVQVGDRIVVIVDAAGLRTRATITQVVSSGDPRTHSYLVKAALDDTSGVRIGMFARAEFAIGYKWGLLIPAEAIVTRADIPGVYIVDENDIAHFRMLRLGRKIDGQYEVLAGLRSGERIVLSSEAPVYTGTRIAASTGQPAQQSPAAP